MGEWQMKPTTRLLVAFFWVPELNKKLNCGGAVKGSGREGKVRVEKIIEQRLTNKTSSPAAESSLFVERERGKGYLCGHHHHWASLNIIVIPSIRNSSMHCCDKALSVPFSLEGGRGCALNDRQKPSSYLYSKTQTNHHHT